MQQQDKPVTINHQMGKIVLHTVGSRTAALRVRLTPEGDLETLGRVYGGSWDAGSVTAHARYLEALRAFLVKREDLGYYYIEGDNLKIVNRRFANCKQPKVT